MTYVYLVERLGEEDVFLLGVFSTQEGADALLDKAVLAEPYFEHQISRVEVDAAHIIESVWDVGDTIKRVRRRYP